MWLAANAHLPLNGNWLSDAHTPSPNLDHLPVKIDVPVNIGIALADDHFTVSGAQSDGDRANEINVHRRTQLCSRATVDASRLYLTSLRRSGPPIVIRWQMTNRLAPKCRPQPTNSGYKVLCAGTYQL